MMPLYTMSFLFLFLLGYGEPLPVRDYKMTPAEAIGLPFDAGRHAPWAADQRSRVDYPLATSRIAAPRIEDQSSRVQTVAASQADLERENLELRQRIEKLEQMMKNTLTEPPVSGAVSDEAFTDKKSVSGWQVELHSWNKNGRLGDDAKDTLLTKNCAFTGRFAQQRASQMHLYRFMATFRVKEPGRYVFANDMTCGFGHPCTFELDVDRQPLIDFAGNTEGTRLVNGLPLTAGDHQVEFRTWLNSNSFINYRPGERFKWHVMVKAPSDLVPREFEADELFSVIPRRVNMAARGCEG